MFAFGFACLVAAGCAASGDAAEPPTFVREVPWAGRGTWIAVDTHTHTTFSDGDRAPAEVVAKAIEYGCRAVAITDHGDRNLKGASPEYANSIIAVRQANPQIVVLAGLEWNVPPWGGDEHATVLVSPGPREWQTLAEFKRRFDDYERDDHASLDANEALRWLAENGSDGGVAPVVVYNHPSRKDAKSMENVPDIEGWQRVNDLVIGFEGGPGHQGKASPGDYRYAERAISRWDPVVARVGDAWDTLLQRGLDVSGAYATSDFHNANPKDLNDRWPCQFSETWLYVAEPTPTGVLRALRAGSMFAAHGHIVRDVEFTVEVAGLPRPAMAGEVVRVPARTSLVATVRATVPATDWQQQPNRLDTVELIGIERSRISVIASRSPRPGPEIFSETLIVPEGGIVLRARGTRLVPGSDSLMFYTNPIRIVTPR